MTGALEAARTAFAQARWNEALTGFRAAVDAADGPEAREGLADSLFWVGRGPESLDERLRAFEGYHRRGDVERAAAVAVHVAAEYRIAGNASLARGWMARAEALAERVAPVAPTHVQVAIERAKRATDPAEGERHAREALALARELRDGGLEAAALSHAGRALVAQGRVAEGLAVLDEAMAVAVAAEGSDPLYVSDACCTTLACCEQLADARRARDWSQAVSDFARRRNFLPVTAWCGAIHAGFLVLTGQWAEAERVLDRALAEADRLPAGDRGTVRAVLASLRVRQGRLREAADLLAGCEDRPAALEPLVAVHLAAGDVALAEERVERRLATAPQPAHLALRARVRLARGDGAGAAEAAAELARAADRAGRDDLAARAVVLAAQAARAAGAGGGRVEFPVLAPRRGDSTPGPGRAAPAPDAAALEGAAATFAALELPLEEAEARMELAQALAAAHPALAVEEARRASATCERLGAAPLADAAAALLRDLGAPGRPAPRTADVLTRREQEVLQLLAEGCSNPDIARRLVISHRTAEHHVRAILRKLDLRNRAEAAAYAARTGS